MSESWSVSVELNGENVVTIEPDCLSGRKIGPAEEDAIRSAACHLLAFLGDPPPIRFVTRERIPFQFPDEQQGERGDRT